METVEIQIEPREPGAKGKAKRLRRQGKLPGVFYGPKAGPVPLELSQKDFLSRVAGLEGSHLVRIKSSSPMLAEKVALVKEMQFHPVTGEILHADFYEVDLSARIRVKVPLHFTGKAEGVVRGGDPSAGCARDRRGVSAHGHSGVLQCRSLLSGYRPLAAYSRSADARGSHGDRRVQYYFGDGRAADGGGSADPGGGARGGGGGSGGACGRPGGEEERGGASDLNWFFLRAIQKFYVKAVLGLGNPGRKYARTRHNLGFLVVDRIASDNRIAVKKRRFDSLIGEWTMGGEEILLVKPQTFMNHSGEAARQLVRGFPIAVKDLVIVHDDLDLPFGRIRIRPGGGAGGHRGVLSILEHLGEDRFLRVRIGIGRPPPGEDPVDFVLQGFFLEESSRLGQVIGRAVDAVGCLLQEGPQQAMEIYNRAE